MTPNWPELWEREPALQPSGWDEVCGSHCEALCRDAAVRWLSSMPMLTILPCADGKFIIVVFGKFDTGHQDNLDAALFAACKAVLASKLQPM